MNAIFLRWCGHVFQQKKISLSPTAPVTVSSTISVRHTVLDRYNTVMLDDHAHSSRYR